MPQKKPKTNKQKTAAKAKTEERETRREVSKQLKAQAPAPAQPVIPVPPLLPLAIPEVINEPEAEMPADPQNIVVIQPPAVITEWAREFARLIHHHEPLNTYTANAIEVFR
jgi:hypothetical protein